MLKIPREDKPILLALGLLVAFLFGVYAEATSQVPIPCLVKSEGSPPNQQPGTEVQNAVTALNSQAPQANQGQCNQEPSSDWWLIWLTGGLVLVSAAQFWMFKRQLDYLKKGMNDAALAANSAAEQTRLAREEFAATHRPD
jgi:hypothetical protein